jgi:hypothetical protein
MFLGRRCAGLGLILMRLQREHLVFMHGAQFFDDNGRCVAAVRLVKIEDLQCAGEGEEKHARCDQNSDIGVPNANVGHIKPC